MSDPGPGSDDVPTPLTLLIRARMDAHGWRLRDVTRPPDGNKTGAPARATMSFYLQNGAWLRTMPRPETRRQLARAIDADPAEVDEAAWLSLASNRGRPPAEEPQPVGRGGHPDEVLPLDGMTPEQRAQVRAYAEFIRSQNPSAS